MAHVGGWQIVPRWIIHVRTLHINEVVLNMKCKLFDSGY